MRDLKNLSVFQEAQINATLDEAKAKWQRQKPLTDYLNERYNVQEIWEIGDFQIAKVNRKKDKTGEVLYVTFIKYKPLHEMAMTLDQALLICLAHKYEGTNSDFPMYSERMLNARFEPEFE